MYNLASILESILDTLDVKKFKELLDLKAAASGMMTLNSSGAWRKTDKSGGKGGDMDIIPEVDDAGSSRGEIEGSESESEDLGVFDSDNIRAALRQMNYQVAYIAYGVCAPSVAWPPGLTATYSSHILLRLWTAQVEN